MDAWLHWMEHPFRDRKDIDRLAIQYLELGEVDFHAALVGHLPPEEAALALDRATSYLAFRRLHSHPCPPAAPTCSWPSTCRTTWQARRLAAEFGPGMDAPTAWVMARLARHPEEHVYAMRHLDSEESGS